MADDDSRTAVEQDPKGGAARLPDGDGQDGDATPETDWKAEARKWERQAKSNVEAAAKLAAIEESQKSEQQKLAERVEQAERRAADAELRALRSEVATAKGLPAPLAARLSGGTREELEADADSLLTLFPANGRPPVPPVGAVAGANKGDGAGRDPADIFASLIKGG